MHTPVMRKEVLTYLKLEKGDRVFDGTCGGGGHDSEILKRIMPGGNIIAVDKDPKAIERAKKNLSSFEDNVTFVNADFREIDKIIQDCQDRPVNAVLVDLGVSSEQIDGIERGFSFRRNGPLDMRMYPQQKLSAWDVVNRIKESDLRYIIAEFGEERHAKIISRAISRAREKKKINTTFELKDIICRTAGRYYWNQKLHPAARTFQGIRIYVNDELAALEELLEKLPDCLVPGGRACFISFHSLEDRRVKLAFKDLQKREKFNIITKKPVRPGASEKKDNPRSRSAKMRVAERMK